MSRQPQDLRPDRQGPPRPTGGQPQSWRMLVFVLLGLVVLGLVLQPLFSEAVKEELTYTELLQQVEQGNVRTVDIDNASGRITGELTSEEEFTTEGPTPVIEADIAAMRAKGVQVDFHTEQPSLLKIGRAHV